MSDTSKAIVVGVGPAAGLGGALCKRLASEGLHVFVAGRTPEKVETVTASIRKAGGRATAVPGDTTKEKDVIDLFDRAAQDGEGDLDLVIYNAGNAAMGQLHDMDARFFEEVWRVGCFGGFLVGREAARAMVPRGRGSILFTGATASLRGGANFVNLAVGKFGLRALAQSMARELGPKGLHVAHVIIDGQIAAEHRPGRAAGERGPDAMLHDDSIAEAYWQLHSQPRNAWTLEMDLRPWVEKF